ASVSFRDDGGKGINLKIVRLKSLAKIAVAGFKLEFPKTIRCDIGQKPCVLEFWSGGNGITSFVTVPVNPQDPDMTKPIKTNQPRTFINLSFLRQPFWTIDGLQPSKLLPTKSGVLSKTASKTSNGKHWARL